MRLRCLQLLLIAHFASAVTQHAKVGHCKYATAFRKLEWRLKQVSGARMHQHWVPLCPVSSRSASTCDACVHSSCAASQMCWSAAAGCGTLSACCHAQSHVYSACRALYPGHCWPLHLRRCRVRQSPCRAAYASAARVTAGRRTHRGRGQRRQSHAKLLLTASLFCGAAALAKALDGRRMRRHHALQREGCHVCTTIGKDLG